MYLFYEKKWWPICGHYFWDNEHGAETFCKKLGYTGGKLEKHRKKLSVEALLIGVCKPGQSLDKCTGNCNNYLSDEKCSNCASGQHVGIKAICTGGNGLATSCRKP